MIASTTGFHRVGRGGIALALAASILGFAGCDRKKPAPTDAPSPSAEESGAAEESGGAFRVVPVEIADGGDAIRWELRLRLPKLDGDPERTTAFNARVAEFSESHAAPFRQMKPKKPPSDDLAGNDSLEIDYRILHLDNEYLSVQFHIDTYGRGAAHPNHSTASLNYDLQGGVILTLSDLFVPGKNYLEPIATYCKRELQAKDRLTFPEGADPSEENYRNWNLKRNGLLLTFDAYQVTSYAGGPQEVTIPWKTFEDILDPDGPIGALLEP